METIDIQDIEIFKTGFWNGREYKESDIDELVESFSEIGHLVKPYLKLGHDENQKLLQKDGYPSAGWLANVKKVGKTLIADFKKVPKKIGELIKNKAYGRISMEMFTNLKVENKVYPKVLRGAALLGADTPAVLSLNDMINLYENNDYEEIITCTDYKKHEDVVMEEKVKVDVQLKDAEEIKNTIEEFTKQAEDLKSQLDTIKKENEALKGEIEKVEFSKKESEVETYLESQIEKGKILPKQKDMFKHLLLGEEQEGVLVFSKEKKSQFDLVKEIIESNEKVDFTEDSEAVETESQVDDDVKLAEKALKFAKENKIDYADALIEVSKKEE